MNKVTLAVLAGGRASRMNGEDKGLITVAGQPMIQHVLNRVRLDNMPTLVIANRNKDAYARIGYPVFSDQHPDHPGPLAGMCVALQQATTDYVLICPCDTPMLPTDLADAMLRQLEQEDADLTVAFDGHYDHPVILLMKRSLLPSLQQYLRGEDRKIKRWFSQHHAVRCEFAGQMEAFANINTPEQRQQLEQILHAQDSQRGKS
ncbi:molybdenum cofactor guanylyltransferase MobA [Ferrimonas pelagia]|uniref:Molybdenum cofactor guanylyltransferase n=1 Tax=Ferrimonas pelagia TaxID=1177826 RepID=A0ABP9F135_9GAMM